MVVDDATLGIGHLCRGVLGSRVLSYTPEDDVRIGLVENGRRWTAW